MRPGAAEADALPEFEERGFHVVTGLLLPIWDRLPDQSHRVYRLVTDEGERIVGRMIPAEALDGLRESLNLGDGPTMGPAEAWTAVLERGATLHLAGGLQVRRARVAGLSRVELAGFAAGAVDALKAIGLTSEIIQWRLRLFLPVTAEGSSVLGAVLARHPLLRSIPAAPSVSSTPC